MPAKFLNGIEVNGDFTAITQPTSDNSTKVATTAFVKAQGYLSGSHTHTIANITGLQSALDSKQPAGSYAAASHTHSIDSITDEHRLFNNMGENHGTRTEFDAEGTTPSINFGWRYVQGSGNGPNVGDTGNGQYYGLYVGLGNDYSSSQYGMQIAIPRLSSNPYLSLRFAEGGSFGAWQKISAAYADSAGSVAWANVTGKPSTFTPSSHTHSIADVSGLQSALDGKASVSHTHAYVPTNGSSWSPHPSSSRDSSWNTFHTDYGYIQFGPANPSWTHVYSDKNFYFNQEIYVNDHRLVRWNEVGVGVSASAVVQRDGNGYIYANHINFSTSETENPSINSFFVSNGDGWSRKASVSHVKSQLGLGSAAYVSTSTFATADQGSRADAAYNWGNHASAGYQSASTAITTSNIGSQSVNYANSAGSTNNFSGLGVASFLRDDGWNSYPGQDANAQDAMRSDFTYGNNAPHVGELIRFGASGYSLQLNSSYGGSQLSYRTRNGDNSTWNSWYQIIDSNNIGGQSVNYASSAGNADTIDGYHLNQSVSIGASPTFGEVYANGWFRTTGYQGIYNPNNNAHWRPNPGSYGPWMVTGTRNGWSGIEFESLNNGNVSLMVNPNSNTTGFHNNSYGWQLRWDNGSLYVGKNSYGGGTDAIVLDSANYTSYAAASSHTHTWGQITDRPTALSQFTNNTGFITGNGFAYPRRSDGTEMYFRWDGQPDQPTWLWGSNDGQNQYVWNPSNFSVNYANSAGYASSAGGVAWGNVSSKPDVVVNGQSSITAGSMYATIFYDSNNSGYYVDPASWNNMNIISAEQYRNYGWYTNSNWNDAGFLYIGGADNDGAYPVQVNSERWGLSIYSPNGSCWAAGFNDISDVRLKKNINQISPSDALDVVSQLNPVTFNMLSDVDSVKLKSGLLAQQAEAVVPHIVTTTYEPDSLMEIKGIEYSQLIPYLIGSIKAQQEMINQLTLRIQTLENGN